MSLPKWGGVSLFVCSLYGKRGSISSGFLSPFPALIVANFQTIGANFQQNRAKVIFYLLALVFSRDFRRQETAKVKYILVLRIAGLPLWLSLWGGGGVHWVQVGRASGLQDLPALALVLWSCVPCLLPAFPPCFGALLANMALFRILRGFLESFMGFRVGLYCWRALRGLCGFCVREWLVGLKARCVFASVFILLCSCFYLVSSFLGLSSCPLLVLSLCGLLLGFFLGCCFFFPYGLYAKKKGRKVLLLASSLRGLWVFRFLYSC